jgi:hypothetical protein
MSSNYPPPQQPGGQNPFGQQGQPQQQYAPPQGQSPYGAPQAPGGFNGGYPPPAPTAPARDNVALGIIVGFVAMLVGVFVYAGIMRAMAKDDGSYSEVSYVAIGVGLLVGAAVGKLGGRNPVLPFVSLLLAVTGVFFGEIVGLSMIASHYADLSGQDISFVTILTDHFSVLFDQWKEDFDFMSFAFLAAAAASGFVVTKRLAD